MKTIYEKLSNDIQKLIIEAVRENQNEENELIDYVLARNADINYIDVISELQYLCDEERLEKEYDNEMLYVEIES